MNKLTKFHYYNRTHKVPLKERMYEVKTAYMARF